MVVWKKYITKNLADLFCTNLQQTYLKNISPWEYKLLQRKRGHLPMKLKGPFTYENKKGGHFCLVQEIKRSSTQGK